MSDFDLTGELSLKSELHMLRPITEKVHSGNGPVSLVLHFKDRKSVNGLHKPLVHYLKWSSFVFSVQIYSRMHADLSLA